MVSDLKIILFVLLLIWSGPDGFAQTKMQSSFQFDSSDSELVAAVSWAKDKALSYTHDDSDPVGYWYEAALPNREAFCMRDVSHQSIGAEILGLGRHNLNMILKFCQNISDARDYASFWEINRYDQPAPVDYKNDKDFWYNLPANFDLIFTINRVYNWTGNPAYLHHPLIWEFSSLSLNEYVARWELSSDRILSRSRYLFVQDRAEYPDNRFGKNRGIPTYNEGGRGESLLGIDMTASYIAGLNAYIEMLQLRGNGQDAAKYMDKRSKEIDFLNSFWWDPSKGMFKSILYKDQTFDYFMVGQDQAFLHYLLYFDVLTDPNQIEDIIGWYEENHHRLIVELKSYLPIVFYENNLTETATEMIIDLCDEENPRRDYPENSFTVIEHVTRGLMGINVTAEQIETLSRLDEKQRWASLDGVAIRGTLIGVKHHGKNKTVFENQGESELVWKAQFEGDYDYVEVNKKRIKALKEDTTGKTISYVTVPVAARETLLAQGVTPK